MPNIRSGESLPASGPVPWRMFTLYPSVGNGWIFLGEVDKFVAVSPVQLRRSKQTRRASRSPWRWGMTRR